MGHDSIAIKCIEMSWGWEDDDVVRVFIFVGREEMLICVSTFLLLRSH
jgi:hypothetical protein